MDTAGQLINVAGVVMLLRDITQADEAALVKLHHQVFDSGVTEDWFHWKYRSGKGQGVGLWLNDEMIAFCGGVPRNFCHLGKTHQQIQIGDVMVRPDWRGVLTKHGPFFHVSKAFYLSRIGSNKAFEAGFGFPSSRHLRLAIKLNLLEQVGEMYELAWHTSTPTNKTSFTPQAWSWRCESLDLLDPSADLCINTCWQRMRASMPQHLIGERHADYIRWRYQQRPGTEHIYLAIKRFWQRQPVGIAIFSCQVDGKSTRWLDWIGRPQDLPMAATLCWQTLERAGQSSMVIWASNQVAEYLTPIANTKHFVTPIGAPCVSAFCEPRDQLPWWFMGGDTDFL